MSRPHPTRTSTIMRSFLARFLHPLLRRCYVWWNSTQRYHRFRDLDLVVLPGVFHPGLFGSTRVMAEYIGTLGLEGRTFLELGAGTGLIALIAARRKAIVTASDVSAMAVRNVRENAARNRLPIAVVHSDLFNALPQHFDVIAINPPYYANEPRNDMERAFHAGKDLDYFVRLIPALRSRLGHGAQVYMVLSANLDRAPIDHLAAKNGIALVEVHRGRVMGETQVVYRSTLHDGITTTQ